MPSLPLLAVLIAGVSWAQGGREGTATTDQPVPVSGTPAVSGGLGGQPNVVRDESYWSSQHDLMHQLVSPEGTLNAGILRNILQENGGYIPNEQGGTRLSASGIALLKAAEFTVEQIKRGATGNASASPSGGGIIVPPGMPVEDKAQLGMGFTAVAPNFAPGWTLAGDGTVDKAPAQAFSLYDRAYQLSPTPENLYKRGYAAEKSGDHEQAHSDARKVLQQSPGDKAAESLFMLTRGRPSKVRLLDASALEADDGRLAAAGAAPATPRFDGRSAAAPGASAPERTAESIAAQENAAINGREVTAQSAKLTEDAKLALRVKDVPKALRLSQEAIKADPSNANARSVRAAAFLQDRRYDLAVQEASAGLALAPDSAPLLYTRAVAYGRQKLWQEAYRDADQAVRSSPNSAYVYRGRAAANWGLKRREAMLEDLRAAARIDRRFSEDIKRAIEGPEDVDPTQLFGDLGSEPASAAPAAPSHAPRYALWAAGLALAVLGMLPVLFPSVRRHVTTVLRRGPAVAEDEAAGDGLPASGFWRRYEVTREIGAGGMGVVYEAWDKNLERRVAVKRMRDEIRQDRRERERFLQEARTVAQMRHPNLVEIYSIEEDGDDAYLVFEFVEGRTLHEHIADKGRLSPAEARDVFRGLCAGVDYAHRRGIVHRDLKPANVIVETDGTVKVMDFGVARAVDVLVRQQMTNTVIGTPPYMAPEQEQGVVCAQSDVYALGVCLYEALSGVLPFQGTAGAVLLAKMQAKYEPLEKRSPGLPPALYALVDRALDPKPEARVQSAAELFKELEAAVGVPA